MVGTPILETGGHPKIKWEGGLLCRVSREEQNHWREAEKARGAPGSWEKLMRGYILLWSACLFWLGGSRAWGPGGLGERMLQEVRPRQSRRWGRRLWTALGTMLSVDWWLIRQKWLLIDYVPQPHSGKRPLAHPRTDGPMGLPSCWHSDCFILYFIVF